MAIISCKECQHKISDQAAGCPNCGAPAAFSAVGAPRWRIIGVVLTLAFLGMVGSTLWRMTPRRASAALDRSRDDLRATPAVYQTTAEQLYQDYNANGVATQTRIGHGTIRVSGKIASIEEDAAGHPIVKLATNHDHLADMTLTDDQTSAAAQLARGQDVAIQCGSMHGINGVPAGSQCTLAAVATPAPTRAPARAAALHSTPTRLRELPLPPQSVAAPEPEVEASEATADAVPATASQVTVPLVADAGEPAAADDLAPVRQSDPQAADHIASYCANSVGARNGVSFAVGCRRDEKEAWTRFVLNNEFPTLDDDTRRKCNEPPFPDSYSAKETCARYQLGKTSTSAQR